MRISQVTGVILLMGIKACSSSEKGTSGLGDEAGKSLVERYVQSNTHAKLVFEIDYVPGMYPRSSNETALINGFADLLDKPGGISTTQDKEIASRGADHTWTFDELTLLATDTYDLNVAEDTVKIHVLFVDGSYEKDTQSGKVLGIAWANRHMVIFKQTIESSCSGLLPAIQERVCELAELAVWSHEVGHVIGLVDNGLDMVVDHKDPENGAHDTNDDCVMYWAAETSNVVDVIRNRIAGGNDTGLGFDDQCKADIAAVRERQ